MIERGEMRSRLTEALRRSPIVVLTGPRQAGKTTLARSLDGWAGATAFDLENPQDAALLSDPLLALSGLRGLVVIDEAQRAPGLFPVLRVLVDRPGSSTRFLILGSASPELVGLASESLAGRVELLELGGFTVNEVGRESIETLWLRGGLPRSFTAEQNPDSNRWRDSYISTFLERDLFQLGSRVPATTMRRAWTMIAHYHGQTWNGSELARALDVAQTTVRRYLDALTDALVVRQVQPWFANVGKRQIRSPKVYVRDSGLLHRLLGIDDAIALDRHPKVGASWEGFVIEQLSLVLDSTYVYFWGTNRGAELDLFTELSGRRIGFEIKRTSVPRRTRSMHSAIADLELDQLVFVYPGERQFPLGERMVAVPAGHLLAIRNAKELLSVLA